MKYIYTKTSWEKKWIRKMPSFSPPKCWTVTIKFDLFPSSHVSPAGLLAFIMEQGRKKTHHHFCYQYGPQSSRNFYCVIHRWVLTNNACRSLTLPFSPSTSLLSLAGIVNVLFLAALIAEVIEKTIGPPPVACQDRWFDLRNDRQALLLSSIVILCTLCFTMSRGPLR